MTLIDAILKKVASHDSLKKYSSPPPELNNVIFRKKSNKRRYKYSHIKANVDCSAPSLDTARPFRSQPDWIRRFRELYFDNIRLLIAIRKIYLEGGRVDSRWAKPLSQCKIYFDRRKHTYSVIQRENRQIYERLKKCRPRVEPTASLLQEWKVNKQEIIQRAECKFVLFPVTPKEDFEDASFISPKGVNRPRVHMTLRTRGAAVLGTLTVELFTDVCPNTCQLFRELLDGDGLGYGYVGTQFFRKVPHLFWSGGDVVYDNGQGCYAQRGRHRPINAENYHFSHSMPGLVSMRVAEDNEMCGVFTISFKPLPQLDLKSVVFGRIVRPCRTYDVIKSLGSPLSTHPRVEICSTRRREGGTWIHGSQNTRVPLKILPRQFEH